MKRDKLSTIRAGAMLLPATQVRSIRLICYGQQDKVPRSLQQQRELSQKTSLWMKGAFVTNDPLK